jgi:hypothetical protein
MNSIEGKIKLLNLNKSMGRGGGGGSGMFRIFISSFISLALRTGLDMISYELRNEVKTFKLPIYTIRLVVCDCKIILTCENYC